MRRHDCSTCGTRYVRSWALLAGVPLPDGWIAFACPHGHEVMAWKPAKAPQ